MDVTELAECVGKNPDDIMTEVLFQDLFGVSPSYEMSLPKTDRGVAMGMLRHSGLFAEWQLKVGTDFDCPRFELNGLSHKLNVVVFNHHMPCRYHVSLKYLNLMRYNRYGDNLVELLVGMFKSEL